MKAALKNKLQQKLANSEGFTLLEILVVLTIMGFLIAMVAPRLAGIAGDAVDNVCDTNQSRMIQNMAIWWEKRSNYPNKMTNLVEQIDDAAYQIPAIVDGNPDNGAETLAAEFMERSPLYIHYLSTDEVKELKGLGVVQVLNLNAYDAYNEKRDGYKEDSSGNKYDPTAIARGGEKFAMADKPTKTFPAYEPTVLKKGVAVAMVGMGVSTDGGEDFAVAKQIRGWGEEDFHGRIVLGFGPENAMITSGLIANAAHCPGGIQDAENVTYNDYNLVLPRLEATAERMEGSEAVKKLDVNGDEKDGIQVKAVSYGEDDTVGDAYAISGDGANPDNFKIREITLGAQEPYMYATMCPEGHKFPADEGDFWAIATGKDVKTVAKEPDPFAAAGGE